MRIDMIYYPTDFFAEAPEGVDVEASGRTFAALVTTSLSQAFPGARINVWYNATSVHSADEFEIHWEDGEIASDVRRAEERRIRDRVATLVGEVRSNRDWVVRVLE